MELEQVQLERDREIANLEMKISNMRSNYMYLEEQIKENENIISGLGENQKIYERKAAKLITHIEKNNAKIEFLNQKMEEKKYR